MAYAQLVRMNGREEYGRTLGSEDADAEFLATLNEEPQEFFTVGGVHLTLYPKGFTALKWIGQRDWLCSWLAGLEQMIQTQVNEMRLTADQLDTPVSTLDKISSELTAQMAKIIHVITTEGPGMPDDPDDVPDHLYDLRPVDLARINKAFFKLQLPDLQLVPYLMGPQKSQKGGKRYGWSVFYTRAGKAMQADPQWLMDNKALAGLLVNMHLQAADMAEFRA